MNASPIPAEIAERAEILVDQFRHIEDDCEFVARILMALGQGEDVAGLTKQQAVVLTFTRSFIADSGFSPTYDEIAEGVGLSAKSRVCAIVDQLQERGFVRRLPGRARSITIVGRA
ncbi:LexA family protein [Devosia ginsengisoli]|uniref:LexA repressor DNA-binding domain-containing protein n=1 Tax=Devosia ginsengisoli TaxID=400770 RepID=A0A5B8LQM9_9HYPH|nr:hypothetical protein [Devosia ginsengisoli]QDZ10548.1 hypothetical protein FPZ08_07160 [Devosia ginsengisoli]